MALGSPGQICVLPLVEQQSEEKESGGSDANTITSSEQFAIVQDTLGMKQNDLHRNS